MSAEQSSRASSRRWKRLTSLSGLYVLNRASTSCSHAHTSAIMPVSTGIGAGVGQLDADDRTHDVFCVAHGP